jgi:hypothetical protein
VDRIKSTLSSDLDHLFSITVRALTGHKDDGIPGKISESDKAKLTSDMFDCLRTYDALELWRDAEDVLRREVVREFVKKVNLLVGPYTTQTLLLPLDRVFRSLDGPSIAYGASNTLRRRLSVN